MKFGKRIRFLASPEWKASYVNYKGLKQLIKALSSNNASQADASMVFRNSLTTELEKVNAFVASQLAIVEGSYESLRLDVLSTDTDEALYLAIELSATVDKLSRFVVMNYLATVKIVKKFDKVYHSTQSILSSANALTLCNSKRLDDLFTATAALTDQIVSSQQQNSAPTEKPSCCPICLAPFKSPVTIACNHTFCWSCLSRTHDEQIDTCPLCRTDALSLDPRDYEIDGLISQFVKKYHTTYSNHRAMAEATHIASEVQAQYRRSIKMRAKCKESVAEPQSDTNSILSIAHRGASGYEKGNTLAAFEKAIELSSQMIELDVQICASGEIVVFHDTHFSTGDYLADLTLQEIHKSFDRDIPTISQVLELVRGRASIYFDLKSNDVLNPLIRVLEQVLSTSKSWKAEQFVLASFNHYQLLSFDTEFRNKNSNLANVKTVVLSSSIPIGLAKSFENIAGVSGVAIDYKVVTREFVTDAHDRGLDVYVWTVNSPKILKLMAELNVDGIVSDYPDKVLSDTSIQSDSCCKQEDSGLPTLILDALQYAVKMLYPRGNSIEAK